MFLDVHIRDCVCIFFMILTVCDGIFVGIVSDTFICVMDNSVCSMLCVGHSLNFISVFFVLLLFRWLSEKH